jgi:hypothetical protein
MSEAEILAACRIKWQQFLIDAKLSPAQMSDRDRMIFWAAFVYAAQWAVDDVTRRMLKRGEYDAEER